MKKNEAGFTLVEMVVVIAILAVFIAVLTSLLITPLKMTKSILYERDGNNAFSLLETHMTQSIRKNGAEGAISIANVSPEYPNTLQIEVFSPTPNGQRDYLYYYYDIKDKKVYFECDSVFRGNKDKSFVVAEQVERFDVAIVGKDLELVLETRTDDEDNTIKEKNVARIYLKAN